MNPSKESIDADSKIAIWDDVKISRGDTREGIPWIAVSKGRFAEFRCQNILIEFIPVEDMKIIAGMIPHVDTADIRGIIEDVMYSPT